MIGGHITRNCLLKFKKILAMIGVIMDIFYVQVKVGPKEKKVVAIFQRFNDDPHHRLIRSIYECICNNIIIIINVFVSTSIVLNDHANHILIMF